MKELTTDQRAETRRLQSVEAKYLDSMRDRHPHLTDDELRLLCRFTDDLLKVIDARNALLSKAYDSLDNHKVWAWAASALSVILFLIATGIVRLP